MLWRRHSSEETGQKRHKQLDVNSLEILKEQKKHSSPQIQNITKTTPKILNGKQIATIDNIAVEQIDSQYRIAKEKEININENIDNKKMGIKLKYETKHSIRKF